MDLKRTIGLILKSLGMGCGLGLLLGRSPLHPYCLIAIFVILMGVGIVLDL